MEQKFSSNTILIAACGGFTALGYSTMQKKKTIIPGIKEIENERTIQDEMVL